MYTLHTPYYGACRLRVNVVGDLIKSYFDFCIFNVKLSLNGLIIACVYVEWHLRHIIIQKKLTVCCLREGFLNMCFMLRPHAKAAWHFKSSDMIMWIHLIRKPCAFCIIISKHALTKLHETKENKNKYRLVFVWRYMYI